MININGIASCLFDFKRNGLFGIFPCIIPRFLRPTGFLLFLSILSQTTLISLVSKYVAFYECGCAHSSKGET